jgi:hypothetical protein
MCLVLLSFPFNLESLFALRAPKGPRLFALIASELVGHPQQRTEDYRAIVAGQVNEARLDDESAELNEMSRPLATLDLPLAHVMPRQRRLMPVAGRPVAP